VSKASNKHVVPVATGGWAVKSAGATRAARTFATQAEAVQYARSLAKESQTVLYVHARDGSVVSKRSFEPPKIRIRLKARDRGLIEQSSHDIIEAAKRSGAIVHGPVPLPQRMKRYDILRSPRLSRTADDPHDIRTHQRLMDVLDASDETLLDLQQLRLPSGVQIEIKKQ